MQLMPFVMIVAVIGMIALMITVGGRDMARNPMFLIFPMMMVMSMAGMFMGGGAAAAARPPPNSTRNARTTSAI